MILRFLPGSERSALIIFTVFTTFSCASTTQNNSKPITESSLPPTIIVSKEVISNGKAKLNFRTISEATKMARPGDVVHVYPGVYEEKLLIEKTGTSDKKIIFQAHGDVVIDGKNHTRLIKGEDENKKRIEALVRIEKSSFIEFNGFELRNSNGFGLDISDSNNILISNCHIHHTWSRGLGGSGDRLSFKDNLIHHVVLQNENERTFKTKEKDYWSSAAATWYKSDGSLSSNILWEKNTIHDSWGEGLNILHATNVAARKNTIYNSYSVLLYVDHSEHVVLSQNLIFLTSKKYLRSDVGDLAIGIAMASEHYKGTDPVALIDISIENNIIANTGYGITFWRDPGNKSPLNYYKNIRITHNLIYNTQSFPFSFRKVSQPTSENLIYGNIVTDPLFMVDEDKRRIIRIENLTGWTIEKNNFESIEKPFPNNWNQSVFTSTPPNPSTNFELFFKRLKKALSKIPQVLRQPKGMKDFFGSERGQKTLIGPFEKNNL